LGEGDGGVGESCPTKRKNQSKAKHREVIVITIFFPSKLYSFVLEREKNIPSQKKGFLSI